MALKISYRYYYRDVAQFGRALRSGRKGRVVESRHPDQAQSEMAVLLYFKPRTENRTGLVLLFVTETRMVCFCK